MSKSTDNLLVNQDYKTAAVYRFSFIFLYCKTNVEHLVQKLEDYK